MIATRLPRSWRAVRIGEVQPLSAILPAILRQYGLQLPPEPSPLSGEIGYQTPHQAARNGMGFDDSHAAE